MRIVYFAAAALSALLLAMPNSWAAGGSGGRTGIAPLGAPPSNDATAAYAFRSRMSVDPKCQELSQEADRVFMDGGLGMEAKVNQLKGIEARAKALNCLQTQSH